MLKRCLPRLRSVPGTTDSIISLEIGSQVEVVGGHSLANFSLRELFSSLAVFPGMVNTETGAVVFDVSTAAVAVGMDSSVNHEHCPQETYHVSAPTS